MPKFTYIRKVELYYSCIIEAPDAAKAEQFGAELMDYEVSPEPDYEKQEDLVDCLNPDAVASYTVGEE